MILRLTADRTVILAVGCFFLFAADIANARCNDGELKCIIRFEAFNAVAWTDSGFLAAGPRAGEERTLALLKITRDGQTDTISSIDAPDKPANADSLEMGDARKLIVLPDSSVVLLADVRVTKSSVTRQVAWAARISPRGKVIWDHLLDDGQASTIFHSGIYDAATGKIVIVGRRTTGTDSGRCEFWSQSLAISMKVEDGAMDPAAYFGSTGRGPTNRQALFDIAPGQTPGTYVAAGFVSAAHASGRGKCQDDMLVAILSRNGERWTLSESGRIGTNNADEDAFSIKSMGSGSYVVAGQGKSTSGAPAAQANRIKVTPFSVDASLIRSFPDNGSAKTGAAHYRVVLPLAGNQRLLMAGSNSAGKESPKQAIWQIVQPDLADAGQLMPFSGRSAEVLDAAVSPDGKTLIVGRATNDDDTSAGWFGFVGTKLEPIARRVPDSRLSKLSNLPISDGAYRIPPTALSSGVGYLGGELSTGSQLNFAFSLNATTTLKMIAHTGSGDLDLALMDATGRLVSVSNYRNSATELMVETLPAGEYRIAVIAQTQIRAFELRFSQSQPISIALIREVQKLSDDERKQLSELLTVSGYSSFSNPDIAVGSESVRALLAAQEGAASPVGPNDIGRSVTRALGR